ncbi:MAG: UDP-N-acetylmuramoyl-L-alanyl-D-glutamate--2,6-diaminopimelate ligase, partial [Planctomycetota bacterium]
CGARVVTYGISSRADLRAKVLSETIDGTRFRVFDGSRDFVIENKLVGRHNVCNALAAIGLARAVGVDADVIARGLADVREIPGRLQRLAGIEGIDVFVDYAHTPDALANVARVLRPFARGRLVIVFGCGGDRDRGKRPLMAQAAAEHGDVLVITSDNPRTEDPRRIIDEIVAGLDVSARRRSAIEPDRRAAIHCALAGAHDGDVVLIAGKGHETYQIVGSERRDFDDAAFAIEAAVASGRAAEKGSVH